MRITKTTIEKLVLPCPRPDGNVGQIIYRDKSLPGFGVRVTSNGAKSFVVEKRIGNRNRRITIGRYGHFTVEQARIEAAKLLGKLASGIDPVREKQIDRFRRITVKAAFEDYLAPHPVPAYRQ